jgi:type I restriction enzyme S subunit
MSEPVELEDIAYVIDRIHLTPEYANEGIPLVSPAAFTPFGIDLAKCKQVSRSDYKRELKRVSPESGDILFSRIGTIGEVRWAPSEPFIPLHSLVLVKPYKDKVDARYLYYSLRSESIQAQAKRGIQSISVPDLGIKLIKKFRIPLPPLGSQKRIGTILEKVDLLLQKRQEANQLKTEIMPSVFLKMFGDPIVNPCNWPVENLGKHSDWITKGGTPTTYGYKWEKSGILFLRSECITTTGLNLAGSMRISEKAHEFMQRSHILPGDILIRITGDVGISCRFPEGLGPANINQHIARIRLKGNNIDPVYLLSALNTDSYSKYYKGITRGVTHPHLSLEQIRETPLPIPPIEDQQTFSLIVEKMSGISSMQERSTHDVNELFHSLLDKAFSGGLSFAEIAPHS